MKKVLLLFVTILMLVFTASCEVSPIQGIQIESENNIRTIKVEETLQLTAVVFPETADQVVLWESENEEIATVDENGLVTAVAKGTVNIVATAELSPTISKKFSIIVEEKEKTEVLPESISLSTEGDVLTAKAGETIKVNATVLPAEANQSVVWSSSDESVATVSRGEVKGLKEGTVEITATAKNNEEVKASITLTFEKADQPIVSGEWADMPFTTHAEYMTAEKDSKLKVKGVVTHISPAKDGKVTYTLQDGTEGYYVYAQDAVLYPVELGKSYEVGGYKKYYNGLNEIVNVEYFKALEENIEYTVNNLDGTNPSDLAAMEPYHCSIVSGSAIFDNGTVNDAKAYSFYALVDNNSVTFRVDPSYMSAEEYSAINEKVSLAVSGMPFTFEGIMTAFGYGKASPQIMITKAENIVFEELTTEELLEAASNKLEIASSVAFSSDKIELPVAVEGFDGLEVTWSSNSELINVLTGAVTHDEEDVTVTLTATLDLDGKQVTKEFDVLVFALDNKEYEVVAELNLEDALPAGSYGNSETKSSYKEGNVFLGGHTWMLRNALIASSASDRREGEFSIRAQSNKEAASTARIEILDDVEFSVLEFAIALYGNDAAGAKIRIEYSTNSGETWAVASESITVDSVEMVTYRVNVPEGANRVAIIIVENTGRRVNIDNIKLMK